MVVKMPASCAASSSALNICGRLHRCQSRRFGGSLIEWASCVEPLQHGNVQVHPVAFLEQSQGLTGPIEMVMAQTSPWQLRGDASELRARLARRICRWRFRAVGFFAFQSLHEAAITTHRARTPKQFVGLRVLKAPKIAGSVFKSPTHR